MCDKTRKMCNWTITERDMATITTDGINIESFKENLVYRIIIPKRDLDEVVDITIPIENALDTAIKKIID